MRTEDQSEHRSWSRDLVLTADWSGGWRSSWPSTSSGPPRARSPSRTWPSTASSRSGETDIYYSFLLVFNVCKICDVMLTPILQSRLKSELKKLRKKYEKETEISKREFMHVHSKQVNRNTFMAL